MLTKTSINNDHYHLAYFNDAGGITTTNDGHYHNVMAVPMENELVFVIMPVSEQDPHDHNIEEYVPNIKNKKKDDTDIIKRAYEIYDEALEYEQASLDEGYEADEYYSNNQWDTENKNDLEDKNRACLTVNLIESKFDNLFGYQRQNRSELNYLPTEGGDQSACDIMRIWTKNVLELCYYQKEKSKVFEDLSITGKGVYNIYDYRDKNDIYGRPVVEKFNWDDVLFLPHEKEDLSDCDGFVKRKWYTKNKLKAMWPDKADTLFSGGSDKPKGGWVWDREVNALKKKGAELTRENEYMVLEIQEKEYRTSYSVIFNGQDGYYLDGWKESDIKSLKSIPDTVLIPLTDYSIRVSIIAPYTVLEDYYLDEDYFSLLPVYAKRRNGRYWGKVRGVVGLQDLINKTYSQFIDILNKVANYGYYYDQNTFISKKEEEAWKNNVSSPGFTAKVKDKNRVPVKEEGVRFPSEIVNAIALFNNTMREFLNINVEMQGQDGGTQSGVVIRQKITQQLLGNDYLFDNLAFAEKYLGRILIKKFQKLNKANPQRVMRLIINQANKDLINKKPFNIGEIEFDPKDELHVMAIMQLLENSDFERMDAIVSDSPYSPSAMIATYAMLVEMAGRGESIPASAIVKIAPIPEALKQEILEAMESQSQTQQKSEQSKNDTEIQKTLIAAQSKMAGKGQMQ